MYKIKQKPEDFVVKEILELELGEGNYSYYLLKKMDYSTIKAVEKIAERLRINKKYINFAGNKDKKAVTEQFISINKGLEKDLELKDISLKFLGKGKERINLGDLEGNEFIITVRNLTQKDLDKFDENVKKIDRIPNYFDEQRFGVNKDNHIIGKAIIKKDFKKACSLIGVDIKGNDYVGALKSINKKILRLYVHAYQSFLWNETVSQFLESIKNNSINKKIINYKVPIIGFSTETEDEEIKKIIDELMEKENMSFRDFIIREIPELSSEGNERDLFIKTKNFKIVKKGKDYMVLSFYLEKGSYATNVVKFLFNDALLS